MKNHLISSLLFALALVLSGCGAAKTLTQGFQQSQAVASDLETSTGVKPFVGFNWNNGVLMNVNVQFGTYPRGKTFEQISDLTRRAIKTEFSQNPQQIIIAFALEP